MRLFAAVLAFAFIATAAHADDALWTQLAKGGNLILMRHGLTSPGVGDPPGFKLADCTTQRNLIDEGRAEAKRAGAAAKARNVPIKEVRTSPWCRCVETARIAFASEPVVDTMLSNLFTDPHNREAQVAAFRTLRGDATDRRKHRAGHARRNDRRLYRDQSRHGGDGHRDAGRKGRLLGSRPPARSALAYRARSAVAPRA